MKSTSKRYSVAELFCGCGGFSHGFALTGRFDVLLGVDIKEFALATFAQNHRNTKGKSASVIRGDLRTISIKQIEASLAKQGVGLGQLDCLIGGPPCQGFSQMRRGEVRFHDGPKFSGYDRLAHDPRNDLVLRFLEIANVLRPRFIVIENVPQMLQHGYEGRLGGLANEIKGYLENEMRYFVDVRVVNSADYGVPQLRERALFLASRDSSVSFPAPTHTGTHAVKKDRSTHMKLKPWVSVRDAIADLPSPKFQRDILAGDTPKAYGSEPVSGFARGLRSTISFPNGHVTRKYDPRIIRLIRDMKPGETWDSASERMRLRYDALIGKSRLAKESVEQTKARLIATGVISPAFYKRYYWSAYTRLDWAKPALTITANANFLGSGRFTHPTEDRGITPREAARLQSFSDDFTLITNAAKVPSKFSIGVGMDMIGEAVPPLLARALAAELAAIMDSESALRRKHSSRRTPINAKSSKLVKP